MQGDGSYAIELSGGSGDDGPATAADCYIRAVGELEGAALVATFTAVETDTFSYSEKEAGEENRTIALQTGSNVVEVLQADTFGYCGAEASFAGRYQRRPE